VLFDEWTPATHENGMDANGFNHAMAIFWKTEPAKPAQRAEFEEWLMHIS
jgi:hypothetical protein